MRLTDFWERMTAYFGAEYVGSVAQDHVLSSLGGRTVVEAIEAGIETKQIWKAVYEAFDIPYALK
ncbi:DUF3046 domain-containing protein [Cumulibacter manganitolerans]|uniref:DUF3046 domain-containing protein n=1 Tax=Cumulibacter manganitolerans TaxID=1884992 RepID=UPI0012953CD1|nr:DUF3046 domain-containing protein [Cumulibacter manganitolerans]